MRWLLDETSRNLPQTHALVIGVGDYLHLPGGELFDQRPAGSMLELGQLISPLVSARAFAGWLVQNYDNPNAPLGSVELLLSSGSTGPPNGMVYLDECARHHDIRAAFERWCARCDGRSDNVALLYFCGHGLQGTDTLLLPADFGADEGTPFSRAINFSKTRQGMRHCRAETQLYFLDCCRELCSQHILSTAPELKTFDFDKKIYGIDTTVYRAASFGGLAFAPAKGGLTFFTDTLIRCLDGLAAEREVDGGRWRISTGTLGPSIARQLARVTGVPVSDVWESEQGVPHDINEVDRAVVLATISCKPAKAHADAHFRAYASDVLRHFRSPQPEPWELELEPGTYDFEAFFPAATYMSCRKRGAIVYPPYFSCTLDVVQ